ncbi:hypothetical protein OIE66_12985 [Nonomuraea sp. NBC_01738]|uniref:hypothetical protein n=1 Tax=Nonomuraea sp. NBC_01738 TaxID=2976003 RepID=UPI002E0E694E|nr:hypothetical protein OIE66_12985 [Nonomuraea sp. NBC_01738]
MATPRRPEPRETKTQRESTREAAGEGRAERAGNGRAGGHHATPPAQNTASRWRTGRARTA